MKEEYPNKLESSIKNKQVEERISAKSDFCQDKCGKIKGGREEILERKKKC